MKKRKKTYRSAESYARHEETQRVLRERIEFHRKRHEALKQREEKP